MDFRSLQYILDPNSPLRRERLDAAGSSGAQLHNIGQRCVYKVGAPPPVLDFINHIMYGEDIKQIIKQMAWTPFLARLIIINGVVVRSTIDSTYVGADCI